jgi:signal transduction histidine kinase
LIEETGLIQFIALAISTITFLFFRDIIQRFIDKLFYRESYNSTKMVEEFEKQHSGIYMFDELSEKIRESMKKIFHTTCIVFAFNKRSQTYHISQSCDLNGEEIDEEFTITEEADFYVQSEMIFSIEEIREKPRLVKSFKEELVVPMISAGKAFGMIILGPKLSERSYSLQDVNLLSVLSKRIVALFKTAELYERDLNRHLMLEEERVRIAKDIHDEVGAKLTRISIMSEGAKNKNTDASKTDKWLQSIAETSREVTQDMTQIIWALSPQNNTMEGLIAYLRRYSIEYLEPANMECQFVAPENLNEIHLRPEARRNVYLCVKEALNNIVKHSGAGKVIISVIQDHEWISILIKDNGNGFEMGEKKLNGNGMSNMKTRMLAIGGKACTRSGEKEGTEVLLMIPLLEEHKPFVK